MQSIGERLEEARKRKGISIREAAEATKIRGEYLHKYEGNQFDIKLPEIYVRGFLRTYANYLKLPADKIVNDFNALGLNETKSNRSLNREVYGRMDLSVASTKPEKDAAEANGQAPAPSEPSEPVTRNPATFVPKPAAPMRLDRNLLLKGGILAGVGIIAVVVIVFLILGRHDKPTHADLSQDSPQSVWVKPVGAERSFSLIAEGGPVQVTATASDGTILFNRVIPAGESREIPRRGKPITIRTDTPENLKMRFDGYPTPYPMPTDPNTRMLMHTAIIDRADAAK